MSRLMHDSSTLVLPPWGKRERAREGREKDVTEKGRRERGIFVEKAVRH